MTVPQSLLESFYPIDWTDSVQLSQLSFIFPLQDHAKLDAESMRTLFAPSAGALYVYRPSKKRRVLNRAVDRLEASGLPGYEYAISHLYNKYRRNLAISTICQTGQTLVAFLSFFQASRGVSIEDLSQKDIAAYVEHISCLRKYCITRLKLNYRKYYPKQFPQRISSRFYQSSRMYGIVLLSYYCCIQVCVLENFSK